MAEASLSKAIRRFNEEVFAPSAARAYPAQVTPWLFDV
jgi:hypothetical protein